MGQERPSFAAIWLATRPRTLPAAVAPVLVGTALAAHDGRLDLGAAGLCLLFALLIQIGTNFANDYYDFVQGADTAARVGPRRAVAAGLVRPEVMKRADDGGLRGRVCGGTRAHRVGRAMADRDWGREHRVRRGLHGRAVALGLQRARRCVCVFVFRTRGGRRDVLRAGRSAHNGRVAGGGAGGVAGGEHFGS